MEHITVWRCDVCDWRNIGHTNYCTACLLNDMRLRKVKAKQAISVMKEESFHCKDGVISLKGEAFDEAI